MKPRATAVPALANEVGVTPVPLNSRVGCAAPSIALCRFQMIGDQRQAVCGSDYDTHFRVDLLLIGWKLKSEFLKDASQDGGKNDCRKGSSNANVRPQTERDVRGSLGRTKTLVDKTIRIKRLG